MKQKIGRWAIRLIWKWMAIPEKKVPTGLPGIRDPQAPCSGYSPRRPIGGDFNCIGDGHYLCRECAHWNPEEEEPEDRDPLVEMFESDWERNRK